MQYIEQTEIEDQLFPSDNILEVPTLDEMLASRIDDFSQDKIE